MSEINSSDIGTQAYWEDVYKNELMNYEDDGLNGEIWFGLNSQRKMTAWLLINKIDKMFPIIDIGCGNGQLLQHLAYFGFQNITGIDYVQDAITLTRKILDEKDVFAVLEKVDFLNDLSSLPMNSCLRKKYKIALDKGTYDAICMCPEAGVEKAQKYRKQLFEILEPKGYFMIVSCNWTRDELLSHFSDGFKLIEELRCPTFVFGGEIGQTVTILVFQKE